MSTITAALRFPPTLQALGVLNHVGKKRVMNTNPQTQTNNMNKINTNSDLPHYEIKIKGPIDNQWQTWFDDLTITLTDDGNTLLCGPLADQAALQGVLKKINNLGLTLISVNPQTQSD